MKTPDVRLVGRWFFWLAMLAGVASVLLWARGDIDQSHVALTLLLVVLGGSAGGGRPLGFLLALLSFVLIDYYFQPPYELITVDKPLDGVVLVAFLASAFVTTELVTRARGEAATARQRGDEIASLARLGSDTLRYAQPEEALAAVAELVRGHLGARRTAVRLFDEAGALAPTAIAENGEPDGIAETRLFASVAGDEDEDRIRHAAAVTVDGSVLRGPLDAVAPGEPVLAVAVPLVVESRRVGAMVIVRETRTTAPSGLSASERRFLGAIGYYAALGAERLRLAREAEQAIRLRQEAKAKDEVLATVSHDLRTPLTTIKLLAQKVADRGDANGAIIEEHVDRLAELVTNVLDLSRIRAGGVMLNLELNTAEDLVGAAISRASGLLRDRKIVPHIDWREPALSGHFDFVQSLRILGNLLDNALRYSPPNGVVDIEVRGCGAWIEIAVADQGPGIPAPERERIFEPFYRPRSDTPDVGHAGLGLSIAKRLAELQGGEVTYTPRLGGGSVFTLRLPMAEIYDAVASADD